MPDLICLPFLRAMDEKVVLQSVFLALNEKDGEMISMFLIFFYTHFKMFNKDSNKVLKSFHLMKYKSKGRVKEGMIYLHSFAIFGLLVGGFVDGLLVECSISTN